MKWDQTDKRPATNMEAAYMAVKRQILHCDLPPGQSIHEGQIAEALQMSKTPVREALAILASEGLVTVRSRQGYRVSDVSFGDVNELFHLRSLLEPAAAALAAQRASAEDLKLLRSLAEEEPNESYEEAVLRSGQFLSVLAEVSGNRRLDRILRGVLDELLRLYFVGLELEANIQTQRNDHRELLDALLKGNHRLAAEMSRRQVETCRMMMVDAILASVTSTSPDEAAIHIKLHGPAEKA